MAMPILNEIVADYRFALTADGRAWALANPAVFTEVLVGGGHLNHDALFQHGFELGHIVIRTHEDWRTSIEEKIQTEALPKSG
jgi:hypothetical protein